MLVSVCIANYKQDKFLPEALDSISKQTYKNIEVKIYDDKEGVGSGEAFNRSIAMATGDVVMLLCADDFFTDSHVIEDIVKLFKQFPDLRHVSRWYYQFVDTNKMIPCRAWRGDNVIELANNPSGLAFRKSFIGECKLTNKMFIEAPFFVFHILNSMYWPKDNGGWYSILKYDTVAVRVHKSTARSPEYYQKMWTSSPVLEWAKLGWKSKDFTSLVQIKNYFSTKAVWKEICNFVKVDKWNLIEPGFWFYSITALITHRAILNKVPEIYRATLGKWTTREVKREKI